MRKIRLPDISKSKRIHVDRLRSFDGQGFESWRRETSKIGARCTLVHRRTKSELSGFCRLTVLHKEKDAESTLKVRSKYLGALLTSFASPYRRIPGRLKLVSKKHHIATEKGLLASMVPRRLARYIFTWV